MTGTVAPTLPSKSDPRGTADARVKGSLVTLRDAHNELLTSENKIPDTSLASPNNSAYRELWFSTGNYPAAVSGTRYFLQGATSLTSNVTINESIQIFYFAKDDYGVAGKTQKLRMRAQHITASTGPGVILTCGMYPVTAVSALTLTVGTVVTGSTVAFASTASNTLTQKDSTDFAIPSDGYYIFAVANSGTTAASGQSQLTVRLQTHTV